MKFSNLLLVRNAVWTSVSFGLGQLFRLITNVALARLLAPELFGIMVIINSVRTGIDLISDIGIGQNLVYNSNAENPQFYNTAWTLRLIRAVLLWCVCIAIAGPVARFYEAPFFGTLLPVAGLFFLLGALGSLSPAFLQRRMQFVRLNSFELSQELFSSLAHVTLAYFIPTIWALVVAGLVATATRSACTYLIVPNIRHKFLIVTNYARQIFSFGRWVFISSIIYFLSLNFDRLYYAKVALFAMVGVYGIARTLSELIGALVQRVGSYLVFPLIAGSQNIPREELRAALSTKRIILLLACAVGIGILVTAADLIIRILYDQRYHAAAWMLPILFLGAWFSIVANLNESTLLGFGKPFYGALANTFKFTWLVFGLPLGFTHLGILGVVVVVAASDLWRYVPILVGQIRERFSFPIQDLMATLVMFTVVILGEWLRWRLGYGTSVDGLMALHRTD